MSRAPIVHASALPVLRAIAQCGQSVTNTQLMELSGCSRSQVEYAMKRLAEEGCIEYLGRGRRYRKIAMTARGRGCLGGNVTVARKKLAGAGRPRQRLQHGGETKPRRCLMCDSDFRSGGPGNRICPRCQSSREWQSSAAASHVVQETP